jgi:hypothetical protein
MKVVICGQNIPVAQKSYFNQKLKKNLKIKDGIK